MTNRDKINGMSNAMLADILNNVRCELCIYRGGACRGKSCFDGIEAWLNAPCANDQKINFDKHVDLQKVLEAEKIKELADIG